MSLSPHDAPFRTTVPGFPRVGRRRLYKRLLEEFWSGALPEDVFTERMSQLHADRLSVQERGGLDLIPSGDFSLYDHVLDTAVMLGCIPARFRWDGAPIDHALYFAMARGRRGVPPLEMTKWFDTNYHYLVPELPERFTLTSDRALEAYRFSRQIVGAKAKPTLLGPFTFLKLARLSEGWLAWRLEELTPIYARILQDLAQEGASLVQIDEPALVGDISDTERAAFERCYRTLGVTGASLLVQTCYGSIEPHYAALCALPIAGLGLDFVRGRDRNLVALEKEGFPEDKLLIAGIVDGRNIWRTDLEAAFDLAALLTRSVAPERLVLSASCSLLHLPESVAGENLPPSLKGGIRFAQERLQELSLLARALRHGKESVRGEWDEAASALRAWREDGARHISPVRARVEALTEAEFTRPPYEERAALQRESLGLPRLPTTTIGSFPQTDALRQARAARDQDPDAYRSAIYREIESVIRLQEEIGLDVLVHGEPERNDMVQFFGDQMRGFVTTRAGWVQSYGSRCVRPPILYGDVERVGPMTVSELKHAQSLTAKPVKGMLTGPITILQWSFVREDIPREDVAYQIALAIRDEVRDLEREAGLRIIQIDEAAFREGLPLRAADRAEYIRWAVRAFQLASSGAEPGTQVHTHMCYSEFGDMLEAIVAMNADVISIEDARSEGALLDELQGFVYPYQIGPGVYDIHSPNVPTTAFIVEKLQATLRCLPASQVWVNPDCGLKTRGYTEVISSLKNMVAAAREVRASQKG